MHNTLSHGVKLRDLVEANPAFFIEEGKITRQLNSSPRTYRTSHRDTVLSPDPVQMLDENGWKQTEFTEST